MAVNNYYYDQLNKEQKTAYHEIYTGLTALAPSFSVLRLSPKEIADIYFLVRMDHPEIFYTVKYSWKFYPQADHIELIPEYLFNKSKVAEHRTAMANRTAKLARQIRELKSEEEKLLFIHDFMVENVHYDKLKKPYSHEIIGALGNGVAVCEGIAKSVKILCDQAGLWCIVVLSENNPEKGIRYRHAWNLVKVNGKYYHLDATFDNSVSRNTCLRRDYFLLSDRQIYRDHEPSIYRLNQAQDEEHTYYRTAKLSFTKQEEVAKRAAQAAKKNKPFLFHWRGGYLTREILLSMAEGFKAEAEKRDKVCCLSVNWPQSVLFVSFKAKNELPEAAQEETYTLEQANEGELYEESDS